MVTDAEMDEALASGCESGAELSLGLNDGSDSEFDEDPEPRPSRFVSESAATVSDCPDPAVATDAKPSSGVPQCQHCDDPTSFADHADGCSSAGVYRRYAECPRCRHVSCTRGKFRNHQVRCLADEPGLTNEQRRNRHNARALMRASETIVKLESCPRCKQFEHFDPKMLALHELFCRNQPRGRPPPALPARSTFYRSDDKKFNLPIEVACKVANVFRDHIAWRVHTRLGFLWMLAERTITCASPQVVDPEATPAEPAAAPVKKAKKRKVKSVVTQPAPTKPAKVKDSATADEAVTDHVSPLLLKRHRGSEKSRHDREPRFTITKRRHRSPSPRRSPVHRQSRSPARHQTPVLADQPPLRLSPKKTFAFGQTAVIPPKRRWDSEEPVPTPLRTPTLYRGFHPVRTGSATSTLTSAMLRAL